jgi:hypothetical protein
VLDGSARIRAVLAFHTAVFELALETGENHPGLLILDTPKQQEFKTEDFRDYFKALRELIGKYPESQMVFSSSEFDFEPTVADMVWDPSYPGEDHEMYLGQKKLITAPNDEIDGTIASPQSSKKKKRGLS